MNLLHLKTVIIFTIIGLGYGITLKKKYIHVLGSKQLTERLESYTAVSRIHCLSLCDASCFYVSYNEQERECGISAETSLTSMEETDGWSLYQPDKDCPNSEEDFIQVGSYEIALCQGRFNAYDAKSFCAKFGRLIEIRTEEMFDEINSYLVSLPKVIKRHYYTDFHVAGEYDDQAKTWIFPNGDPLPMNPKYTWIADKTATCVQLKEFRHYWWDDISCVVRRSYMCEKL